MTTDQSRTTKVTLPREQLGTNGRGRERKSSQVLYHPYQPLSTTWSKAPASVPLLGHTAVRLGVGGNRLAGARLRLEFLNDLARLGEPACFVLGEHKFAIYENVEDTVAPRDQP